MSKTTHYETAPQDRIPFLQKVAYGVGALVNNLLASSGNLIVPVLNLGFGMNPALAGLVASLPRLTDAITDPLMGYISDNTRSRWGRRRPYIFVGAIAAGLLLMLLWQLPDGKTEAYLFWYFLIVSLIFFLAYTMFATPWVALGYELTPDYHERTRLMGVQNWIGQPVWMIAGYYVYFTQNWFDDMRTGAASLAIIMGIIVIALGILPAILLRERFKDVAISEAARQAKDGIVGAMLDFLHGFATTIKFKPFLKLCLATFLIFNGFQLIASYQIYVITYFVFDGDIDPGSKWTGHAGLIGAVSTLLIIPLITWVATKIGKRRALIAAIGISMIGYASKWFLYDPATPWTILVPAPLQAFGLGSLFTIMPSMIADVVDMDELNTHQRREGMYGSIFWWVVKLGLAVALLLSGFMLNWTGFDVEQATQTAETITMMRAFDAFVPVVTSLIAIWAIVSFPITEERAYEVRQELERRRGTVGDPAAD
ncbi:MAG: MFS transporter [Gammaproteobacteria bacterium]|nr:MFS transporter [Gammaproteobacteria bacterium]NNF60685.1 MFS transporter [Gammaproteobacteria bacterium]NNM19825.1 MFS transporter [Gammaproteobacteria bacterium]